MEGRPFGDLLEAQAAILAVIGDPKKTGQRLLREAETDPWIRKRLPDLATRLRELAYRTKQLQASFLIADGVDLSLAARALDDKRRQLQSAKLAQELLVEQTAECIKGLLGDVPTQVTARGKNAVDLWVARAATRKLHPELLDKDTKEPSNDNLKPSVRTVRRVRCAPNGHG